MILKSLIDRLRPASTSPFPRISLEEWPDAVYAIGDVHGCLSLLEALHAKILDDSTASNKLIVMIGDYVDRGPDSAGVLDFLQGPLPAGVRRVCLAGNHEAMMLAFLANPMQNRWLEFGGAETLRSYHIDLDAFLAAGARRREQMLQGAIPPEHVAFMQDLPAMLTLPGYVFVHAGLRPGLPLERQSMDDLMWIRNEFYQAVDTLPPGQSVTVHGHTPGQLPVLRPQRICVDTGAYLHGRLTAVRLRRGEQPAFLSAQ